MVLDGFVYSNWVPLLIVLPICYFIWGVIDMSDTSIPRSGREPQNKVFAHENDYIATRRLQLSSGVRVPHRPSFGNDLKLDLDAKVAPPGVGVALSGGGIRSAAFALGALGQFCDHDHKSLDSIDIISSVSGGNYTASSWMEQILYDSERRRWPSISESFNRVRQRMRAQPGFIMPVNSNGEHFNATRAFCSFTLKACGSILVHLCMILIAIIGVGEMINLGVFADHPDHDPPTHIMHNCSAIYPDLVHTLDAARVHAFIGNRTDRFIMNAIEKAVSAADACRFPYTYPVLSYYWGVGFAITLCGSLLTCSAEYRWNPFGRFCRTINHMVVMAGAVIWLAMSQWSEVWMIIMSVCVLVVLNAVSGSGILHDREQRVLHAISQAIPVGIIIFTSLFIQTRFPGGALESGSSEWVFVSAFLVLGFGCILLFHRCVARTLHELYRKQLRDAFYPEESRNALPRDKLKIWGLADVEHAPLYICNTVVNNVRHNVVGKTYGPFAWTQFYSGSNCLGYFTSRSFDFEMRDGMGLSGAALAPAMGRIEKGTKLLFNMLGASIGSWIAVYPGFDRHVIHPQVREARRSLCVGWLMLVPSLVSAVFMALGYPCPPLAKLSRATFLVSAILVLLLPAIVVLTPNHIALMGLTFIRMLVHSFGFVWPGDTFPAYLYLSDGGHFENLGVFELFKRRVRTIHIFDGGEDPECECTDLRSLFNGDIAPWLEHAGVRIVLENDIDAVVHDLKRSCLPVVLLNVQYLELDKTGRWANAGTCEVFYRKCRIAPESAKFIELNAIPTMRCGRCCGCRFPKHPTANQFFSPGMFEQYYQLGYAAAQEPIGAILSAPLAAGQHVSAPVAEARSWYSIVLLLILAYTDLHCCVKLGEKDRLSVWAVLFMGICMFCCVVLCSLSVAGHLREQQPTAHYAVWFIVRSSFFESSWWLPFLIVWLCRMIACVATLSHLWFRFSGHATAAVGSALVFGVLAHVPCGSFLHLVLCVCAIGYDLIDSCTEPPLPHAGQQ